MDPSRPIQLKRLTLILLGHVVLILIVVALAAWNQRELNRTQEVRYQSHLLADALRQSSEDLTRAVRVYVATGAPDFETEYWHILAVRNGEAPLPDGRRISLRERMRRMGFSPQELAKLDEAEANSNHLVITERIAMNAVKGLYLDRNGKFTRKAAPDREHALILLHDENYLRAKDRIMRPITDVEVLLDERTSHAVDRLIVRGTTYLFLLFALALSAIAVALAQGPHLARQLREEEERRKDIHDLRKAVKRRDAFLSEASHELKTPMTPLVLKLQLILRMLRTDDSSSISKKIIEPQIQGALDASRRMARLMEVLLNVSRMRSGHAEFRLETFDLGDLAEQIVQSFEPELSRLGLKVELERHGEAVGTWDRTRIEQVAVNLLQNAMRYGKGRPIFIRVRGTQSTGVLEITDQGIGIAPQDRERIFERFTRAVGLEESGGLGIGLFISKEIVQAHGGSIHLSSELGMGSTFVVELPRRPPLAERQLAS